MKFGPRDVGFTKGLRRGSVGFGFDLGSGFMRLGLVRWTEGAKGFWAWNLVSGLEG